MALIPPTSLTHPMHYSTFETLRAWNFSNRFATKIKHQHFINFILKKKNVLNNNLENFVLPKNKYTIKSQCIFIQNRPQIFHPRDHKKLQVNQKRKKMYQQHLQMKRKE